MLMRGVVIGQITISPFSGNIFLIFQGFIYKWFLDLFTFVSHSKVDDFKICHLLEPQWRPFSRSPDQAVTFVGRSLLD
jgi:hypothetical protein